MHIKIYTGLTTKDGKVIDNTVAIINLSELIPFDGCTILQAKGVYKGTLEDTLIVEVYINDNEFRLAEHTAVEIRNCFNQECVMLVKDNEVMFI